MRKVEVPISKAYRLINYGPVVLVTSAHKDRQNVMTVAWTSPLSAKPMLVGVSIASSHLSCEIIRKSEEFVINIPTFELKAKVEGCGSVSGREVDKFKEFGLTPEPASKVRPPLIKECAAHLECSVVKAVETGDHTTFVGEVEAASAQEGFLTKDGVVDISKFKTLHHLGGEYFATLIEG
jgi:flavin reductase (DIM6/NTAB) family NADH-FMN oxidoreductase RutF